MNHNYINIGTIGHVDYGYTIISSLISTLLTKKYQAREVDFIHTEEIERGITIQSRFLDIGYGNSKVNCPIHAENIKKIIIGENDLISFHSAKLFHGLPSVETYLDCTRINLSTNN